MLALDKAIELVEKLERTRNYPRDPEGKGVEGLARGLQRASETAKVAAARIVEKCAAESEFCPTDYDFLNIAKEIARLDAVATGTFDSLAGAGNSIGNENEWREVYGPAKPFKFGDLDMAKVKRVKNREREMFAAIKTKYPGELSWRGMIDAARELGYKDYADAWEKGLVGGRDK